MSKQEVWTSEQLKAWAKTRKDPAGDLSGRFAVAIDSSSDRDKPITKNHNTQSKSALHGLIVNVLKLSPVPEFQFAKPRRFRFDWAFPDHMIAIEYEGLFSEKSGHTTASGYTVNCQKYNLAAIHGWRLLRYTAMNYREILIDLPRLIIPK